MKPRFVLFDLNHTVHSLHTLPEEEPVLYIECLKIFSKGGQWAPLQFSDAWRTLPAWNDASAIEGMQWDGLKCITLSNNPIDIQIDMARNSRINWDWMIPLESYQVFKPDPRCYRIACDLLKAKPEECVMVTANREFGDLREAGALNMHTVWIDRKREMESHPIKNLHDVKEYLRTLS